MEKSLKDAALDYHKNPVPGKIAIKATKPMATPRDLSLAYSPGVAAPCLEIEKDPLTALDYTSRGNLVAVITNGTAVLGLGNIGPLAAKPVMEGKSVLFKKFAGIDSVDIEVDELDPDKFIEIVASLEPSFGGINLEDIKAPECFEIEKRLKERMNIPVFHDDQHGTAIIVSAAFTNWLYHSKRDINKIKVVCNGAGASAISCLNLLVRCGLPKDNITVCDSKGVITTNREDCKGQEKGKYAKETNATTLEEAIKGADFFLGLSVAGAVSKDMVASMNDAPLLMTLANPTPEIMPELVKEVKSDAIICTGRSDYPNQVNNVLCFPFIFRGALDVGATAINEEMKVACVKAIAELARKETPEEVNMAYDAEELSFGENYLIPKPLDPRLVVVVPMAVAKTAMETGVATRPIKDFHEYRDRLDSYYTRSRLVMRPIYEKARLDNSKRVVFCEGEEEKVLMAVQTVLDEKIARPILIGRERVIKTRIRKLSLRIDADKDIEIVDPENDSRYYDYWTTYHKIMERKGVPPAVAKTTVRTNTTVIGGLMVYKGDADAVICGSVGFYRDHLKDIDDIIGLKSGASNYAAMNGLILSRGTYFFLDTQVNPNPDVASICETTIMAADEVKKFGMTPKVALLSYSSFGSQSSPQAVKMRDAYQEIKTFAPYLEIDGEMHADAALNEELRKELMPNSTLKGSANIFVMPDVESANISFHMSKSLCDGTGIGPILLGAAMPAHILTPSASVRGIVNMAAIANVSAQMHKREEA